MFTLQSLCASCCLILCLISTVIAQVEQPANASQLPAHVTVTASAERVRFTAPNTVVQLRLEVYMETGQKLFDTELRGGNVLDWSLQDGQGQRLADGEYLCMVTVKNLSGRLSQKLCAVKVVGEQTALRVVDSTQLTSVQAQAVGPVEESGEITVIPASELPSAAVITHDGTDGQVTRTRGAFSFRFGDFFSGKDTEQMRLTEEGNLGIGTATPKVKLDVVGMISAREGLMFGDGSTLNVDEKGVLARTTASGEIVPNIGGTGTQNRVAKWTDNAGTLGDSALTETGGNVGLGVTNPVDLLDIAGAPNVSGRSGLHVRTTTSTGNATVYFDNDRGNFAAYGGLLTGGSTNPFTFFGVTRADKTFLIADGPSSLGLGIGTLVSRPVIFGTGNVERMRIGSTGNVGIGTNNPAAKLDVVGDTKVSGTVTIGSPGDSNTKLWVHGDTWIGFPTPTQCPCPRLVVHQPGNFGLRVQTDTAGGLVASFGGFGNFEIDASNVSGGRFIVKEGGNTGIGTNSPLGRLQVVTATDTNPLSVTAWDSRHFVIGGSASSGGIGLSYDQTNNVGYISSLSPNVLWRNLVLQAGGGNVGIGTTAPGHKLHVNGTVAGVGPYVDASDLRYKRDIRPIGGALSKVLSLRGVTFDWRREEFPALDFAAGRSVGFVAQEVERVVPEAVTRDAAGFRSVAYSHLTPVLVEAVKEQQAQIEEQQQQLQQKHARIEKLEARLATLETVVKNISARRRPRR